jgi:hypothetical protein
MIEKYKFSKTLKNTKDILVLMQEFNSSAGTIFGNGKRNTIKLFELDGGIINIKSFKIPNLVNKIAYKYFRKSKARRSFEYATILLEKGIGTPEPIAFLEHFNWMGLKESYYSSVHLPTELTFRELVDFSDYPEHEIILRQFTRFTFSLHEKGIEFLDHSPGNTLIKKVGEKQYQFFLVDLNRMNFHSNMDFKLRMNNFSRLTPKKEMIAVMSDEYAKLYTAETKDEIFERMWFNSQNFQEKFAKKQRLKQKLKFWKA